MYLDSKLQFSDSQALTATAVSTNVIDLGVDQDIGVGEPMAIVINTEVALAGTSPTINVALQTDDNAAFSSAVTLLTTQTFSALPVGTLVVIPVPNTNERYLRLNYTLGGTTPTVTVSAHLIPLSLVQADAVYADAITIS